MDHNSFWKKQTVLKPLFPDLAWSKPERRDQAGKLGIIGGNKLGFAGVAEAYSTASQAGIGATRVLLPDVLKKTVPASMTDVVFGATTPSGSLSQEALVAMSTIGDWADGILLIGDAGRNSETAVVYEQFIQHYDGMLTITRDAVDLVKNSTTLLVDRPNTLLVVSFAQLQKLFQAVYYPKILTFSMQLAQLVEAVHKFTITYPVSLVVLHQDTIVIASDGEVVTQPWDNAMAIWRGTVATNAACYWLWSPSKPLDSITTSIA